jgi:hypothetical protein
MAEIILSEYQGAFIKKDGICYEYLESTTDSVTDDNTGIEIFGSCELCLDDNSSSSDSSSESSESSGGVNNPPSASNWPSYIPITEGVSSDFDLSGVTFSDPEGDNITLTLTSGDGVFDLTSGGGVIVTGSGTGTITLLLLFSIQVILVMLVLIYQMEQITLTLVVFLLLNLSQQQLVEV